MNTPPELAASYRVIEASSHGIDHGYQTGDQLNIPIDGYPTVTHATGYPFIGEYIRQQVGWSVHRILEIGPSMIGSFFLHQMTKQWANCLCVDQPLPAFLQGQPVYGIQGLWEDMTPELQERNLAGTCDVVFHHRLGPTYRGPRDFFTPVDTALKPGGHYISVTRWWSDNPGPLQAHDLQDFGYQAGTLSLSSLTAQPSDDQWYDVVLGRKQDI